MNDNSLDALFSGLTGAQSPKENGKDNNLSNHSRKDAKRQTKENGAEERFCTIVSSELLHKIRVIAKRERLQIKEVVNAAFEKAISSYERKHGTIDGDVRGSTKNLF